MKQRKAVIEKHPGGYDTALRLTGFDDKASWPAGGTPLAPGVQPPGFLPVTQEIIDEIVCRLVTALDPEKIILFGSYAYGAPSDDSDIDLLVVMQTGARPVDRYVTVSRTVRPRPFPLDILVKTPDEITGALTKGDHFIQEIVNRGRVLYARRH